MSDIFHAILQNNLKEVEKLLKDGIDIEQVNKDGIRTPLMLASEHGFNEIVKCLINYGADVNGHVDFYLAMKYAFLTPLSLAAFKTWCKT
jgi:ankyrin repeat protein